LASDEHGLQDVAPVPGAIKPDPILVADGIVRRFGGLTAVDVAHLEIPRGRITALIGPNGAGKTTLFNVLTGFDTTQSGTWSFDGGDITRLPAHRIAQRGMVRTFQLTKSLNRMRVLENMLIAPPAQRGERLLRALGRGWRAQEQELVGEAMELLRRFRIDHMIDEYAGEMSGGQRKLLEMARALMARPTLLMLDEPMAGVNPALTQSLLDHITALRGEGISILFVEHDMDVVMGISDWVVVMAEGQIIAEGTPRQIAKDPHVVDAYLGTRRAEGMSRRADEEAGR
jgi:neutral amino acid transport system ATP-binding protein